MADVQAGELPRDSKHLYHMRTDLLRLPRAHRRMADELWWGYLPCTTCRSRRPQRNHSIGTGAQIRCFDCRRDRRAYPQLISPRIDGRAGLGSVCSLYMAVQLPSTLRFYVPRSLAGTTRLDARLAMAWWRPKSIQPEVEVDVRRCAPQRRGRRYRGPDSFGSSV